MMASARQASATHARRMCSRDASNTVRMPAREAAAPAAAAAPPLAGARMLALPPLDGAGRRADMGSAVAVGLSRTTVQSARSYATHEWNELCLTHSNSKYRARLLSRLASSHHLSWRRCVCPVPRSEWAGRGALMRGRQHFLVSSSSAVTTSRRLTRVARAVRGHLHLHLASSLTASSSQPDATRHTCTQHTAASTSRGT